MISVQFHIPGFLRVHYNYALHYKVLCGLQCSYDWLSPFLCSYPEKRKGSMWNVGLLKLLTSLALSIETSEGSHGGETTRHKQSALTPRNIFIVSGPGGLGMQSCLLQCAWLNLTQGLPTRQANHHISLRGVSNYTVCHT